MSDGRCYEKDAIFQCHECGRSFRRDQCRTRKGSLECPRCLPSGICGTLRYTALSLDKEREKK